MSFRISCVRFLSLLILPILILTSIALGKPSDVKADEQVILEYGTATIDGHINPTEWENSATQHFNANVPPDDGGGTLPVDLYIMNDDANLYLALKIGRSPFGRYTNPMINIDVNNNNVRDHGDEYFGTSVGDISGIRLIDGFFTTCPTGAVCGLLDLPNGGTLDVHAAATTDEQFTYIELSHPLDSSDNLHDMSVGPGDTIGLQLRPLRLSNLSAPCNLACSADTYFPAVGFLPLMLASQNQPPVADPLSPVYGFEGTPIHLDGTGSYDPDGDPITYDWNLPEEFCPSIGRYTATPEISCYDDGAFSGRLYVGDGQAYDWETINIFVENVPPSVGEIGVTSLNQVGDLVEAGADFNDLGREDTHSAIWDWGDGTQSPATRVSQEPGGGEAFGSHIFTNPGVYKIILTVTDDDGDSGQSIYNNLIVYDPSAGFVTGGGWIWSYPGTYVQEPNVMGWANFGFVAKYHKGAEVPDGQAELVYHTAGMNFHSTEYEWLVVTGEDTAKFKGNGTINGEGDYKFMIWASDGDPDTFRIKIWEEINGEEIVTYDNSLGHTEFENGQPIGNGNILVQGVIKPIKEVLDQSHTGFMLGYWFDSDDIRWQEFLPTYDNLSSLEVYLGKDGNPGNVIVEIRTLDDQILAQNLINESEIHRYGWVRVEYSEPLSLIPGTKYRIYVYADQISPNSDNRYFWFGDRDSPYDSNCETDLFYFMPDFDYAFRTFAIPK